MKQDQIQAGMGNQGYTVRGFKASSVPAGLKKGEREDLALIFSEMDADAAGVFTTNRVKAAPVVVSREHLRNGKARAILANSGNANACTGESGKEAARRMAELAAKAVGVKPEEVLVASTGVIGAPLDTGRIESAMPRLAQSLSKEGLPAAARAIMTTDSFEKMSRFEGSAGHAAYRIVGIAKGAGMIMPHMATMLCFVLTDVAPIGLDLNAILAASVDKTLNRITVDGDMSTNDTVFLLANGAAGNTILDDGDREIFALGVESVLEALARMIVRDGEGATKLVHVMIKGARTAADALNAARTVANSCLVKTAFYGQDPNWGRIMAALGRSGIVMQERSVDIWVDDVEIVSSGLGKGPDVERRAADHMKEEEFRVTVDLHQGDYEDRMMTCDLTHDYVSINADYRT